MRSKKTAETACVKIGRDGGRESNEGESRLQWSARFFSRRFRSSTHCLLVEAKGTGEKMRPRLDSQRGGARRTVSFGSFLVTSRFLLTSSSLWSPLATDIPLLNSRSAAILSVSSPSSLIDLTKKALLLAPVIFERNSSNMRVGHCLISVFGWEKGWSWFFLGGFVRMGWRQKFKQTFF